MLMLHRRRWGTIVTVFVCSSVVVLWAFPRLSNRPLLPMEVFGVVGGIALIIAAFVWARDEDQQSPNRGEAGNGPQLTGAFEVQIDGSPWKGVAPPAGAAASAKGLRWCGKNEVLTAKTFLLREPLVYYSLSAPPDDEPSCIDLSLDIRSPGRSGQTNPSAYPTYAGLSPPERAEYLDWLSKDRTTALEHVGYAFLFISGLERRLLLERRPERDCQRNHQITQPLRIISDARAPSQPIPGFLVRTLRFQELRSPALDDGVRETAFELQGRRSGRGAGMVSQGQPSAPRSLGVGGRARHPRIAGCEVSPAQFDRLKPQFTIRYSERFGAGLKLKATTCDREIRYRPVNASLEYRDDSPDSLSWSITIGDVLGHQAQFDPLADLLAETIRDLPRANRTEQAILFDSARSGSPPKSVAAPSSHAAIPLFNVVPENRWPSRTTDADLIKTRARNRPRHPGHLSGGRASARRSPRNRTC